MKAKKTRQKATKYVSVRRYATLCGVTHQMVYLWIKKGLVAAEKRSFGKIIDIAKNGIRKKEWQGRKSAEAYLKHEQSEAISL